MKKSLLQAVKKDNQDALDSFVNNGDRQESKITTPKKEKTKRIVVDLPESKHIEVKIFASKLGISIKQLVMIALEDAMNDED